jgi:hypothetical protein
MYDELVAPICRKIPGFLSAIFCKYSGIEGSEPEWDYVYIETWESKEAYEKALKDKVIGGKPGTEVYKTGFVQKAMSMMEKLSSAIATPVYSLK